MTSSGEGSKNKREIPGRLSNKYLEQHHAHCADFLMNEYGVEKEHRRAVLDLIQDIYDQGHMFHDMIIHGVRGYMNLPQTDTLKQFLEAHKTKEPLHNKGDIEGA
jgi:hypothetical protein